MKFGMMLDENKNFLKKRLKMKELAGKVIEVENERRKYAGKAVVRLENKEEKVIFFKTHEYRLIADAAKRYDLKVKFEVNRVEDKLEAEKFDFVDVTLYYLKQLAQHEEEFHKFWKESYYAMLEASMHAYFMHSLEEEMQECELPLEDHPELKKIYNRVENIWEKIKELNDKIPTVTNYYLQDAIRREEEGVKEEK